MAPAETMMGPGPDAASPPARHCHCRAPPDNHPQRIRLHNEVHSRPPEAIVIPSRLSYLALYSPVAQRDEEWRRVCELARDFQVPPPAANASHYSEDFGAFRLKWERHTEFARYTFTTAGIQSDDPFSDPAITAVPAAWLSGLPGSVMVATHVAVMGGDATLNPEEIANRWFNGHVLIGASVGGGAARAFADFRIQDDGFSRLLLQDRSMSRRQCGRMVQRLLEIDTYRIMALLALPVAQEAGPIQTRHEQELAEITEALAAPGDKDEQGLLDRLTQLDARIESRGSDDSEGLRTASPASRRTEDQCK